MPERESMQYDVVIVGAGPAGLAAAIRLKQLAAERSLEISVCVLEKGSEVGAHILSGAVMDPRSLNELIPDWQQLGAPLNAPVTEDRFLFLTERASYQVPDFMLPGCFKNHGNYVVSLGNVCRWLGQQAEALGVEIFAGFAAAQVLYSDTGVVKGVITGDVGINREGEPTDAYQPGMELHGKYTVFAEGCRGNLGKELQERYRLREGVDPQVYGIGLKELWEIRPEQHQKGLVMHTAGWPLAERYLRRLVLLSHGRQPRLRRIRGRARLYESLPESLRRIPALQDAPAIRTFLEGGKRIAYGARAITAGGLQALPRLVFPGGCLVGDDAGFLNASRIKGSHAAMKSGMLAAEALCDALQAARAKATSSPRIRKRSARAGCTTSCIARATSSLS